MLGVRNIQQWKVPKVVLQLLKERTMNSSSWDLFFLTTFVTLSPIFPNPRPPSHQSLFIDFPQWGHHNERVASHVDESLCTIFLTRWDSLFMTEMTLLEPAPSTNNCSTSKFSQGIIPWPQYSRSYLVRVRSSNKAHLGSGLGAWLVSNARWAHLGYMS